MESNSQMTHEPYQDTEAPIEDGSATDAPMAAPPSAMTQVTLLLAGLGLVALGAALPHAPKFSWQLVQADRFLAAQGISHGIVVLSGVLLFGMGLVALTVRAASMSLAAWKETARRDDSDFLLVADQLTTDVAQSLSSLLQISAEVATLGEGQRALLAERDQAGSSEGQNALFRLAASVDRLNAGVEERLEAFAARFEGLVRDSSFSARAGQPSPFEPEPAPATPAPAPRSESPALDTAQVLGQVEETSMEFFESMERIENSPSAQPDPAHGVEDGTIRIDFDE